MDAKTNTLGDEKAPGLATSKSNQKHGHPLRTGCSGNGKSNMETLVEKITAYVEGQRIPDPKDGFAVPGEDSMIDFINPATGRSAINGETLEQVRERYPKAEAVNIEQFCRAKAERQDSPIEWQETTRERYEDMLNVLPPADYNRSYTAFLVGEPWDHHAINGRPRYQAFRMTDAKYWQSSRPMTRPEFRTACR